MVRQSYSYRTNGSAGELAGWTLDGWNTKVEPCHWVTPFTDALATRDVERPKMFRHFFKIIFSYSCYHL